MGADEKNLFVYIQNLELKIIVGCLITYSNLNTTAIQLTFTVSKC